MAGLDQKMRILLSSVCLATSSHFRVHPNWNVTEPRRPAAGSPQGLPAAGNQVYEQHLLGTGAEGEVASQLGELGLPASPWTAGELVTRCCCAQEQGTGRATTLTEPEALRKPGKE